MCMHEKLVGVSYRGSKERFVLCSSCDSIKDSSFLETIDDDLGTGLK